MTKHGSALSFGAAWEQRERRAGRAARAALVVGLTNAIVSAYWAVGGTAGLDTVGGQWEDLARSREPLLVIGIWGVVVLKTVGASLGVMLLRTTNPHRHRRMLLAATWLTAAVLTLYGGTYVAGQALVASGVIAAGPNADWTAIYGHLVIWDPWFLLWGMLLLYVAAHATNGPGLRRRGVRP